METKIKAKQNWKRLSNNRRIVQEGESKYTKKSKYLIDSQLSFKYLQKEVHY
jgi:hypothetical protein